MDESAFRIAVEFLADRLADQATVDWALRLDGRRSSERQAVRRVLWRQDSSLSEPWRTAWRLIEEGWDKESHRQNNNLHAHEVKMRIGRGERSGSLVEAIVRLVRPVLEIKTRSGTAGRRHLTSRPRKVEDILHTSLSSELLEDAQETLLGTVSEPPFLVELAQELDATIIRVLNVGRRLNWNLEPCFGAPLGQMGRAYYVPASQLDPGESEPDQYRSGIAAPVKLLHAVIMRLRNLDIKQARSFMERCRPLLREPVYARLGAALACDPVMMEAAEVGRFLLDIDDRWFWKLGLYPEIAELRARRFVELNSYDQQALLKRVRKGPPRNHWARTASRSDVSAWQTKFALTEVQRIELAGATLPETISAWSTQQRGQRPDIQPLTRITDGFPRGTRILSATSSPDQRYDDLSGEARLSELEAAITQDRGEWGEGPHDGAITWLHTAGNAGKLLVDLEASTGGGTHYPEVWSRFGWNHRPDSNPGDGASDTTASSSMALRVVTLVNQMPDATIRAAIDGLAHWCNEWRDQIAVIDFAPSLWLRLWPAAVASANLTGPMETTPTLNEVLQVPPPQRSDTIDTLNSAAGKLVACYLAMRYQSLQPGSHRQTHDLATMREHAFSAPGRAGLIARCVMIEHASWLLQADPDWARRHLLPLLTEDSEATLKLWPALVRNGVLFHDLLREIGPRVVARAMDERLSEEVRKWLAWSLVIECLHAFLEGREPAIPGTDIQHVLHQANNSIRAHAAFAVWKFVHDLQRQDKDISGLVTAAMRFLREIWPKEYSLATSDVAAHLAKIPACSGNHFEEAVDAVERFLVPFDCWSLQNFRLRGKTDSDLGNDTKLSMVNDEAKASALLRLLDASVSRQDGATAPIDLGEALEQIRTVAPRLVTLPSFLRLEVLARRR